jgi:hypothetical protein
MMHVRTIRIPALLAIAGLSAISLTGCGGFGPPSSAKSDSTSAAPSDSAPALFTMDTLSSALLDQQEVGSDIDPSFVANPAFQVNAKSAGQMLALFVSPTYPWLATGMGAACSLLAPYGPSMVDGSETDGSSESSDSLGGVLWSPPSMFSNNRLTSFSQYVRVFASPSAASKYMHTIEGAKCESDSGNEGTGMYSYPKDDPSSLHYQVLGGDNFSSLAGELPLDAQPEADFQISMEVSTRTSGPFQSQTTYVQQCGNAVVASTLIVDTSNADTNSLMVLGQYAYSLAAKATKDQQAKLASAYGAACT